MDEPLGIGSPVMKADRVGGIELQPEFELGPVPLARRKPWILVAAVWFGFPMILTNAVFGGIVIAFLGFWLGLLALLVGNAVLLVYVGALSYIAGATGRNFALQAKETFGRRGYAAASGFLATIVVGWFAFQTGLTGATLHSSFGWNESIVILAAGVLYVAITFIGIRALAILGLIAAPLYVILGLVAVALTAATHNLTAIPSYRGHSGTGMTFGAAVTLVIATFADSGTMTSDFTRWSKSGRQAVCASFSAFPVASFVAQFFGGVIVASGAVIDPTSNGGNFLPILAHNGIELSTLAVLFVFANLGSVCTHCLYNGAVGWSHILGTRMRVLTLLLGTAGTFIALAGVWHFFLTYLNILGVFVPSIGAIIIVDQIRQYESRPNGSAAWRPTAFIAWALGASSAGFVHFVVPALSDAITGMLVAGAAYYMLANSAEREHKPIHP